MAMREREKLRQLVNDYYHGLITPESYRRQRASLLDNIGAVPDDEADSTATRPREKESAVTPEPSPEKPVTAPPQAGSAGAGKLVIGIIAIAGIAAAGYLGLSFLQGGGISTEMTPSGESAERMGPGNALVDGFLTRDDWTKEALTNFLIAWEALEESDRIEVVDGRLYRRLTAQLHQRIREEIALGAGTDSRQLSTLTGFAEAVGAPYRQSSTRDVQRPSIGSAGPGDELPPDDTDVMPDPTSPTKAQAEAPERAATGDEHGAAAGRPAEAEAGSPVATAATQAADDTAAADDAIATVAQVDPCPVELARTRRPYCRDALTDGSKGPALVVLPTGSFRMGSNHFAAESPEHQVDIVRPIAMSVYEVSVQEYLHFCIATGRDCPASQATEDAPVVSVSWDDATDYTDWLTEASGFKYRLPSEAEWEYAARAGTETPYFFGDEITPSSAHWSDSGTIKAPLARSDRGVNRNPFRLYHMSGNVREWVQDSWVDNYQGALSDGSARVIQTENRKVVRGGSYLDPALDLRSAAREAVPGTHRDSKTGFRIVREIDDQQLKNREQ